MEEANLGSSDEARTNSQQNNWRTHLFGYNVAAGISIRNILEIFIYCAVPVGSEAYVFFGREGISEQELGRIRL